MSLASDRIRIGDAEIIRLLDGTFRVDGGAMFGVVPRTLWASKAAPDRENRVTLALNCYLVRTPDTTLLLDTGVGPDVGRRRTDFYSFDRRPGLFESLAELG
ncbi:MAG: MBL fold metallo-hydrolase, partial [Candidatus Aminicenantales bacterium]